MKDNPFHPIDQETEYEMVEELSITYAILDELQEQLSEACEEQTEWSEEIDRQNLRKLLDDLDAIARVKLLVEEIIDPRGAICSKAS